MVPPLPMKGVSLELSHLHIGPGEYAPGRVVVTHSHRELQLEYVLRGRVRFTVGGRTRLLSCATGGLIAPGAEHAWRSETPVVMLGGLVEITGPAGERFKRYLRKRMPHGMHKLNTSWGRDPPDEILALALETGRRPWRLQRMAHLLFSWLAAWLEAAIPLDPWLPAAPSAAAHSDNRDEAFRRQALQFIEDNYGRALKLDDLALQVGMSKRQTHRLLRQNLQSHFSALLLNCRLRHSRQMLDYEPEMLVKTVAYACGFRSPAYFTACFKRAFGDLPGEVKADDSTT